MNQIISKYIYIKYLNIKNLITYSACNYINNQVQNPYYFNTTSDNIHSDIIIRSYFNIIFKYCLISNINYKNTQYKVQVQFYYYCNNINKDIDPINNINNIKNLCIVLETIYGKKVNIIINRIHYPYINAQIISQYISIKTETNTFINFKQSIINNLKLSINNLPSFIVGIKININGRIITERIIPRKTKKSLILGSFSIINDNNLVNNQIKICKGQTNIKNDIGVFTIQIEIAQLIKKI